MYDKIKIYVILNLTGAKDNKISLWGLLVFSPEVKWSN